jgi:type I restriction enzyme S subunit
MNEEHRIDWPKLRLKAIVENVVQVGPPPTTGGTIGLQDVESLTGVLKASHRRRVVEGATKRAQTGDVIFGKLRPYLGKSVVLAGQSSVVGEFLVLRPRSSHVAGFVCYLLRSPEVLDVLSGLGYGSKMPRVEWSQVGSLAVGVPSLEEQRLIVRYLNHSELRITKAIAAKQRVLSLLQEHKLAKFETAVFGVADGEYSDAASSHPWMGEIPKHWKVVRAKSILKLLSRPVDLSSETVTCFRDGTVTKRSNRGKIGFTESIYFSGYQGVEPGDLVVHQMDAFAGAIGVSDSTGKCTPVYAICKVDASARPEFIAILLKLMARRGWVTALSRGIRVRSTDFRFPVLATQYLPLPPVEEQDAMLDSLAKATADIASAITAVSTEIALLKEYRTRLISDVVTGKLDVRDEAAKLPDMDPMELVTVGVGENGDDEEATDDD